MPESDKLTMLGANKSIAFHRWHSGSERSLSLVKFARLCMVSLVMCAESYHLKLLRPVKWCLTLSN